MVNLPKIWNTFSSAPHRMFFFGGVMQSILTLTWWLTDLGGRYGGFYPPIPWAIPPMDAHAYLMIYGFFPFFIFGFLMTTFPRWMNGEEVERRAYVPAFLLLAAGTLLFYAGLVIGLALLKIAQGLFLAGWGIGLYALLRVYVRAKHPDKRHATITSMVLVLGWLLIAGFASGEVHLVALAKVGGVWLLLLPVFFAVSHRMIPFFTAGVIPGYKIVRPDWALALMPAGALLHAILELCAQQSWTWLADLPMAACAIYLSRAWRLRESLAVPILGMLHIAFAWLGIALLLYSLQSLTLLMTGQFILAKAPMHALTIGYFTSMMLAMVTRVSLGHSGRALVADRLTWSVFLVFQSVAALRVMSELPGLDLGARGQLYVCAGLVWLACFGLWSWKFAPLYWKPRSDGARG
ncbi:NnrS protein [mine drainage metagenome]|uniref:NnrS protein n=1 Tax=mine drainage metagenome TaxID=410659 RepID=A0A1J5R9S3_9ZZZZ